MRGKNFILAFNLKNNLVENSYLNDVVVTDNMIFFPSFLQVEKFASNDVNLGVQNLCSFNQTITGEVTIDMLKKFGVKYCIVGHSERRNILQEDSEVISKKIQSLLNNKITPILCVGEKDNISLNDTLNFLDNQIGEIEKSIKNFDELQKNIILAYEPIFAIGSGIACDDNHIKDVSKFLKQKYHFDKILYGGSVNPNNCLTLSKIEYIDGFLIGGASLDSKKVNDISKKVGEYE